MSDYVPPVVEELEDLRRAAKLKEIAAMRELVAPLCEECGKAVDKATAHASLSSKSQVWWHAECCPDCAGALLEPKEQQ